MDFANETHAGMVCLPCKRRKKACDKQLPLCSRCTRLNVHCMYPEEALPEALRTRTYEFGPTPPRSDSNATIDRSSPGLDNLDPDDLISVILRNLVNQIPPEQSEEDFSNYFENFHHALPIVPKDDFYWKLKDASQEVHFVILKLAMSLVSQLSSSEPGAAQRGSDVYSSLIKVYAHYQMEKTLSIELLLAGMHIACYEYCQALIQQSWLTIGGCIRMGQVIRNGDLVAPSKGEMIIERPASALWWGLLVLERVISAEFMNNKLPLSTQPPKLTDLLPLTTLADSAGRKVGHDLFLADDFERTGKLELKQCDFTSLSPFSTTIQATYISTLVTEHVLRGPTDRHVRQKNAVRLDMILQTYAGALIPPPGEARGRYCGAYGIRTCSLFYLHQTELENAISTLNEEQAVISKLALQSLTRTIIHATKASYTGNPMNIDAVSFWAHKIIYFAALCHIRYGTRDQDWHEDMEVLKNYFKHFEHRFKLHAEYLRDIETEQQRNS